MGNKFEKGGGGKQYNPAQKYSLNDLFLKSVSEVTIMQKHLCKGKNKL